MPCNCTGPCTCANSAAPLVNAAVHPVKRLEYFHSQWRNPEGELRNLKAMFNYWFGKAWQEAFPGMAVSHVRLGDVNVALPPHRDSMPTISTLHKPEGFYSRTQLMRAASPNLSATVYELMARYDNTELMFLSEIIDPLLKEVDAKIGDALAAVDPSAAISGPEAMPVVNVENFINTAFLALGDCHKERIMVASQYTAQRMGYDPLRWPLKDGDAFVRLLRGSEEQKLLLYVFPRDAVRIQVVSDGDLKWNACEPPEARLYFRAPAYDDRQNVVARAYLDVAVDVDATKLAVFDMSAEATPPAEPTV